MMLQCDNEGRTMWTDANVGVSEKSGLKPINSSEAQIVVGRVRQAVKQSCIDLPGYQFAHSNL